MPVRFQKECASGAHILVWESIEEEIQLMADLPSSILTDAELEKIITPRKKLEMLTSRVAIRHLANDLNISFDGVKKDEHGKPYLVNTKWEMSITHSKNFIGVIMHPHLPVGIDIEKPQTKMWRILPRLYSETEIKAVGDNLETLSVYWSAKEALYKLYGKRGVDFVRNLRLHESTEGLMGEIIMPNYHKRHHILQEKIEDYILVWTV
ncbi:4'-phosphopantetheinyl transferase superfamily protein [uncultured Arcticibacterium sp.]|uniref:4'-phosphopantetheinyl transferase family protein n=1 Tax=uncultured Arcticibacterium sp. TaxID=2173042 RepID=UPI0030FA7BCF